MFQKSETEKVLSCHNPYKQKVCKKRLPNFSLFTEKDLKRLKNGNLFT